MEPKKVNEMSQTQKGKDHIFLTYAYVEAKKVEVPGQNRIVITRAEEE